MTKIPTTRDRTVKMRENGSLAITVISKDDTIGLFEITLNKAHGKEAKIRISVNESMLVNMSVEKPAVGQYRSLLSLPPEKIEELKRIEEEMTANDRYEVEIDNMRNQLEGLVFQLENAMERDCPQYFAVTHQTELREIRDWIEANDGNRIEKVEYRQRIDALMAVWDDAMKLKAQYEAIDRRVPELKRVADEVLGKIGERNEVEMVKLRGDLEAAIGRLDGLMECDRCAAPEDSLEQLGEWFDQIVDWVAKH
jgi:molecular chaperone DnaK (HSP70)